MTVAFMVHDCCIKGAFIGQEQGGIMTLTDVYCRVNRARGMEVVLFFFFAVLCGFLLLLYFLFCCYVGCFCCVVM